VTDVVITGRHAPKELVRRADYAVEIRELKRKKQMKAKPGLQY
jgi:ATP:corrinoid adenosyltransferase